MERITSRKNPLLQHVKKLLSSRTYREETGEYSGDGLKLLEEAIRWNAELTAVIVTEDITLPKLPESVRTVIVPEDVMASVSSMESPQGALFACKMPRETSDLPDDVFLVLDGVQDPGNVGTILRTADAMDIPVVLSDGCADLYNPKTVRASMGAVFRSKTVCTDRLSIIDASKQKHIPITVTALTDSAADIREVKLRGAVVIGSEGHGVSKQFLEAADRSIIIPMSPRCESLNAAVAASIVAWELRRQRSV